MTKARQKALEAYPYIGGIKGKICDNSVPIFIQGYEQAIKDVLEKIEQRVEIANRHFEQSVEYGHSYWEGACAALNELAEELKED